MSAGGMPQKAQILSMTILSLSPQKSGRPSRRSSATTHPTDLYIGSRSPESEAPRTADHISNARASYRAWPIITSGLRYLQGRSTRERGGRGGTRESTAEKRDMGLNHRPPTKQTAVRAQSHQIPCPIASRFSPLSHQRVTTRRVYGGHRPSASFRT